MPLTLASVEYWTIFIQNRYIYIKNKHMKRKIKLTESELINLIKKTVYEQVSGVGGMSPNNLGSPKQSISFETVQEYLSNEYNTKNNKKVSLMLTFDGQNVVADFNGSKYIVTRN